MKKFLPIFLFLIGALVLAGVYFLLIKGKRTGTEEEERTLIEVPLGERPFISLTPGDDGHWLKLIIEKITIDAASLDYELLYKLPDGRTQGVPGTIKLEGQGKIERDLLLGSESSGKFRYDEGVEEGTLTLRFRDQKGRLLTKFTTDFHLQSLTSKLKAVDGNFSATLAKTSKDFFVVMGTFGLPGDPPGEVVSGPYGVFTSSKGSLAGSPEISQGSIYRWTGTVWTEEVGGDAFDVGIYIGVLE